MPQENLIDILINLFWNVYQLVATLGGYVLPLLPLLIWVGFWMFAVDWVQLRRFLLKGGWTGLLLLAVVAIIVWGCVSPPADGHHYMLGLTLDNFVGKTVYVTGLICIMFLSGAVQLAGVFGDCCPPKIETPSEGGGGH